MSQNNSEKCTSNKQHYFSFELITPDAVSTIGKDRAKDFTILIRGSDWERFYFLTAQAAQSVRNSLTDSLTLSLNFISGNSSILRY